MNDSRTNLANDSASDFNLVQAILAGHLDRFALLVGRHDANVRHVVASLLKDSSRREDAVQETWLQVYRKLGDLVDPCKLKPWLRRIARHCALEQLKRVNSHRLEPLGHLDAVSPAKPTPWLWQIVATLPEPSASLLDDHYRLGHSYAEIAAATGQSLSTIRGRIYEARKLLRDRLKDEDLRP